ncbi:S41 family peptidase [Olleya sp. YS]|uniref:S41 family peptidase n=1 Tax=Olleya sp. YS TaxID=3028318 RepID=UPI0024341347|nr:S41 family peptidase [Olleya sp. YS]WGD34939.1 S41 family peptidase [Olleya sp. YS]
MKKTWIYTILLVVSVTFTSCFEDIDDNAISETDIKDFVWKGLNQWYFWQQTVTDLTDDRFANSTEYTDFLNSYESPDALFEALLSPEDRFSWIVDDYFALNNTLNGVTKNNGMSFGVGTITVASQTTFGGIVQYILPNTSASDSILERGDIFLTVNGTQLTQNNYLSLLFSSSDTYTIGLAEIDANDNLVLTGETVTLTKQVYEENPIFIANTFTVDGIKVGYLMYNRFTSNYDQQLNDVFANFFAEGVQDLVVDLRYNPGGSVNSAIHLASMIAGEPATALFLRQRWNDKIQAVFTEEEVSRYFANQLPDGTTINSLNLNKVYILAQQSSASASELLINGLEPYVSELIHIGNTTRGKNEFSITLYDNPDCSYLNISGCSGGINPNHTWAMQPLVGKNENANGFYQYENGLTPDFEVLEDIENFGVLGDQNEPLLARAIQHITGNGRFGLATEPNASFYNIDHSNFHTLTKDNMYLETEDIPTLIK